MANFPDIRTAVIDRKDGPLEVGQADGVACRTVEMFEAFGLADRLVSEAYWVNEVSFWRPDPEDRTKIKRGGRIQDTEAGLSEFPHVIVNEARMLAYLRDHMERSPSRLALFYGLHVKQLIDFEREISKMFSARRPSPVTPSTRRSLRSTSCPRPLHRGSGDQVCPVDDHCRGEVPASRGGLPGRDALPLCPGRPVGRRQTARPRPRRPGGRRLAPGAWRLYIFADQNDPARGSRTRELCECLELDTSPIKRFTPASTDPDSVIDVRAIFTEPRDEVHRHRRPDQFVSHVVPLHGHEALANFFAKILIDANRRGPQSAQVKTASRPSALANSRHRRRPCVPMAWNRSRPSGLRSDHPSPLGNSLTRTFTGMLVADVPNAGRPNTAGV